MVTLDCLSGRKMKSTSSKVPKLKPQKNQKLGAPALLDSKIETFPRIPKTRGIDLRTDVDVIGVFLRGKSRFENPFS